MGQERSEVKVEGQKKNYLKIGVGRKQQVLLQGQLDPWLFLLFLTTTQIGWRKGEIIRI